MWSYALLLTAAMAARELPPQPSLLAARDAVRALRQKDPLPEGGVIVPIKAGRQLVTETVAFDKNDSGTATAPIIYRGEPGAILNGGRVLPATSFAPVSDAAALARLPETARGKVLVCDLKAQGLTEYGALESYGFGRRPDKAPIELFVGGRQMTLARYPNKGWIKLEKVQDRGSVHGSNVPGEPELLEKPERGAIFDGPGKDRLARWKTADDLWLFGYWWWDWADQAVKVDRIDYDAGTIKTVQPHEYGYRAGGRYYAFNLLEELDQPGEWYLDRAAGRLYLWPTAPLDGQSVELSLLTTPMVALNGASHVRLEGLAFETMRGQAISVTDGEGVWLAGDRMARTGRNAVTVSGGKDHRVVACDIVDTNGGVHVSGGDRRSLTPAGHMVENCSFDNYARIMRTYNGAIHIDGVGIRAAHNLVRNAPHAGIFFGGNDHVIEFNEFYDICQETSDCGVIYAGRTWFSRGNVIRGNFIHDIRGIGGVGAFGIYLDDCFSSAEVTDNVLANMDDGAFLIGGGRDNIITNNLCYRTGPLMLDDRGLGWGARGCKPGQQLWDTLVALPYKQPPWSTKYPKLPGMLDDEPATPKGNVVERNVFVAMGAPQIAKTARDNGSVKDNLVVADDPGFVNLAALDLRLRPDAALLAKLPGFRPIAVDKAGLVVDAWRRAVAPARPSLLGSGKTVVGAGDLVLATRTPVAIIRYTLDGTAPSAKSTLYRGPVRLTKSVTLRAVAFGANGAASDELTADIQVKPIGPGQPVYLSELPAFDVAAYGGDIKRDQNMAGGAISLGGRTFERGLTMHPAETPEGGRATATWLIDGGLKAARRLLATVGVDATATDRGSVVFIVDVQVGGIWREALRSPTLRGAQPPVAVDVPLAGADKVRLRVTDSGDDIHSDHAAWGGVRFE